MYFGAFSCLTAASLSFLVLTAKFNFYCCLTLLNDFYCLSFALQGGPKEAEAFVGI